EMRPVAEKRAEERLLDLLLPPLPTKEKAEDDEESKSRHKETREKLRKRLHEGKLEDRMVEITVQEKPMVVHGMIAGTEDLGMDFQNMLERMLPSRTQTRKLSVKEAHRILIQQEAERAIDKERAIREAVERAENTGIIFIDELDKVAGRETGRGPDVSREGVQRDMLPIIEGTTVVTRYGMVKTDRILFIAAGAFHVSKPSDLIPEIQGRFPIRVELESLNKEDFIRILQEPRNALLKQYTALLETEGLKVRFEEDAVEEIAEVATKVNMRTQNIGARRLHTVMEKLLEDASFDAPDQNHKELKVDAKYVKEKLEAVIEDEDLSRYIL
ncbi:MAG: ATP-dependent protease ATPase subunit HslU, partial [Candidatus Brocadiales bacterium]